MFSFPSVQGTEELKLGLVAPGPIIFSVLTSDTYFIQLRLISAPWQGGQATNLPSFSLDPFSQHSSALPPAQDMGAGWTQALP